MPQVQGFEVISNSFAKMGLTHCFGIVGIPISEIAMTLQGNGVKYYGFRNEQAAAYAAGIMGYISGEPGLVVAVSGPGMTNCISGMGEALINKRPMIVLSGASDASLLGRGAFQEIDQVHIAKTCSKWAARPSCIKHIPFLVEKAYRMSMYGTPGPVYLDFPADIIYGKCDESEIQYFDPIPRLPLLLNPQSEIEKAISLLQGAKNPLVIVGKGIAYAFAEKEFREFAVKANIPVLASPMGKGVIKDTDNLVVNSART
jgi:2-hydroxyacyl-CoA lyase 1